MRKSLGNKRNEITAADRKEIVELYTSFQEGELCKIFDNEDFLYREYAVMQPLQRSYSITDESLERMKAKGSLNTLYDEDKVQIWQESEEELSAKDKRKLAVYLKNKPLYDAILHALKEARQDTTYMSPEEFMPVLQGTLQSVTTDKKLLAKIADGLSIMDKKAVIQRDKKGNIIYDKETKDIEIVPYKVHIDDYMKKEVLPYVPDAKAFFEEDLSKKKPVIKTGAEIPFTRYFYKYEVPKPVEELEKQFNELEESVSARIQKLFGQ